MCAFSYDVYPHAYYTIHATVNRCVVYNHHQHTSKHKHTNIQYFPLNTIQIGHCSIASLWCNPIFPRPLHLLRVARVFHFSKVLTHILIVLEGATRTSPSELQHHDIIIISGIACAHYLTRQWVHFAPWNTLIFREYRVRNNRMKFIIPKLNWSKYISYIYRVDAHTSLRVGRSTQCVPYSKRTHPNVTRLALQIPYNILCAYI